ncbi:MAG: non-homologous end-joining DNA ligase, partial [Myxococcaceae bacterium]
EDHPLEYAKFEGRIPDGEYGAGDSILWDAGEYQTVPPGAASAGRQKGHLALELFGKKLKGRWHLVRTRGAGGKPQWIFFKAHDEWVDPAYDVVREHPESVVSGVRETRGPVTRADWDRPHPSPRALLEKVWPPMRSTLSKVEDAARLRDPLFEVKYDGFRGLAALSGRKLALWTRNRLDLSARFPEVARALTAVEVPEAVLDGELVGLDGRGVSRFELLFQPGAHRRYVAFDLLWFNGEDLRGLPLIERRMRLEGLLAGAPAPLMLAERLEGESLEQVLKLARARGLEGVMAKKRTGPYRAGRSRDWLKVKLAASQELAIVGFTPTPAGAASLGALLLGVRADGGFEYAGKVGSGFTDEQRRLLREALERDRAGAAPPRKAPRQKGATWVRPHYVAQVRYTEWTRDGRLRHPVFLGLRPDRTPAECVRELPQKVGRR